MNTTQLSRGKKRAVLAVGTLLAAGALTTAAAFTDFANLNLGNGTNDSGVGGNNRFNIQVVGTDANGNPVPGPGRKQTPQKVSTSTSPVLTCSRPATLSLSTSPSVTSRPH